MRAFLDYFYITFNNYGDFFITVVFHKKQLVFLLRCFFKFQKLYFLFWLFFLLFT